MLRSARPAEGVCADASPSFPLLAAARGAQERGARRPHGPPVQRLPAGGALRAALHHWWRVCCVRPLVALHLQLGSTT